MKFKQFINQEFDVDICDDYSEDLCVAFCGPAYEMTEAGVKKFSPLFDVDISINEAESWACVHIVDQDYETSEKLERLAIQYFAWQAGLCKQERFDKYFKKG